MATLSRFCRTVRLANLDLSRLQGDGNPLDEPTPVDAVVYATGYRQQAGFVDPKVVDMRWERDGNDVPLFKGW